MISENIAVLEDCQKIRIDELVRTAQAVLKKRLVEAQIDALGIEVKLTTTKTRFNGERFWFSCPNCTKRIATLYKHPMTQQIGCRNCLDISYKKQRSYEFFSTIKGG